MNFEFIKHNHGLTDEQIINDVVRVKNFLNKDTLILREYEQYGKYGSKAIRNHFGTWNKLLETLGLPLTRIDEHLNKEDIFTIIEKLWIGIGHQPTLREFESETHHTKKIIIRQFGTWNKCLKEFCEYKNDENEKNKIEKVNTNNKHKTPREPTLSLRYQVIKRDNFKCVICGKSPSNDPKIELHIDHIKPYSLGGETEIDNLQTLCNYCNLGKSNKA